MSWFDGLQQDLAYAWRTTRRSPGVTAVAGALLAVAALAAVIPAWRASRADPMTALRAE